MSRARYIRDNFSLSRQPSGQWVATAKAKGDVDSQFVGDDKEEVCRRARCEWGHMNHQDEADAFDDIFPRLHS